MAENENTNITPEHTLTDEEIAAQDVAAVRADAADLRVAKRCRSFVTDLSQQFAE